MGNSQNRQPRVPSIYHNVDQIRQTFLQEERIIVKHLEVYRRAGEQEPQKKAHYEKYSEVILNNVVEIKSILDEVICVKEAFKICADQSAARLIILQETFTKQYAALRKELYQYFSIGENPFYVTLKSKCDDEDEECIVCFEEFSLNRTTDLEACPGCKHHYHAHCINGWLKREGTCPMCRSPIEERQQIQLSEYRN